MLLTMVGVLTFATSAPVAAYPPASQFLLIQQRWLWPDGPTQVTVTGCQPGEQVVFYMDLTNPITVTCGANYTASLEMTGPDQLGRHTVNAYLAGTDVMLGSTIWVVSRDSSIGDGSGDESGAVTGTGEIDHTKRLPETGSQQLAGRLGLGAGILLFGIGFLFVARVRRRDQQLPASAANS